jgi:hypothetical protein
VYARFRYSDMKEAARDCGGRPYANSMVGRSGVEVCPDCAVVQDTRDSGGKGVAGKGNVAGRAMEEDRSGDLLGATRGDTARAQARKEFELERVVSWGQRWRTKLDFRS